MKERILNARLPYLLLGAVLTGLTLVFPTLGFLEWISMIPLFLGAYRLAEDPSTGLRRAYLYGFLTVFAYYFVVYHWFTYLYPLDFVGMDHLSSLVVVLAGWIGLSLLQAIPGGLVLLLFVLLHRTGRVRRTPMLRPIAFAALWIVFEWSSTLFWTGVPWGRLCLGQSEYLPILQTASLLGSYFISFLILLVNGLLAFAILYRPTVRCAIPCVVLAFSILLSNLLLGLGISSSSTAAEDTLQVAVVQGNVNSHEKWGPDSLAITKRVYGEKTRLAAEEGAELVVWPETAFPYTLNLNPSLSEYVSSLASECGVTLIIGALYADEDGNGYNALYLVHPDGRIEEDVYAKRHLVPFGEYVPMRELIMTLIPPLANLSALKTELTPGTDSALFETPWGRIGGLICFDSIYEELALDSARDGAELLVLSSNDSWFFDSAAIYQHEAQAKLRAIETGRYLVRSGNTGISTVISDRGEHLVWIDALVEGYAVTEVEMKSTPTLYTQVGNLFVFLCLAGILVILFADASDAYRKRCGISSAEK